MKRIIAPCYKCNDRLINCHGTCEKYKEYREFKDMIKEKRLNELRLKSAYIESINKNKNKKGR